MPVLQITSQMPNHPANSFYYPRLRELPPMASIRVTRQSRSPDRQAPMSNHILPNLISQRISGEPSSQSRWTASALLLLMVSFARLFQRPRWTVRCLSGPPGVCAWVPAPGVASVTARATSSCGQPTLAPPALSWRSRRSVCPTAA